MRIRTGRQLAGLWLGVLLLFLATAWASRLLLPAADTTAPTSPPPSYYVGLIGLLAVGGALALTWSWARHSHQLAPSARAALLALLVVGSLLWLAAMLFPFL
jgi:hypothetical protein